MHQDIVDFLEETLGPGGLYEQAQHEIIKMEVELGGKSRSISFELRDTLCHISEMVRNQDKPEDLEKNRREAITHLHRCLCEAIEFQAETVAGRLKKRLTHSWWWPILGFEPPFKVKVLKAAWRNAKDLIALGRANKANRPECIEHFTKARKLCDDLLKELDEADYPAKKITARILLLTSILAIILTFAGVFATMAFSRLWPAAP